MPRKHRSRAERAQLVGAWRASGLSAREFAARRRLNARTLQFWASALKRDGEVARIDPVEFIEVATVVPPRTSRFEVHLTNGRWLVVESDFDAGSLARLLALVEVAS